MDFYQFELNDEVFDDVEIDEDDPAFNYSVHWLTLARFHTKKSFSQPLSIET